MSEQEPTEAPPPWVTPWPLFITLLPLTILAVLHACEPRNDVRPQELSCTK